MQPGRNPTGLTYLGDPSLGSVLAWYAGHPVVISITIWCLSPRDSPTRPDYLGNPSPGQRSGLVHGALLVTSVTIGYPVTRADTQ